MFDDLNFLMNEIDKYLKDLQIIYGDLIACKKGCSHCCYAFFDVSMIEGLFILKNFDGLKKQQKEKIIKKAEKYIEELDKQKNIHPNQRKIKCPLLSENNQCVLYDARPVNCRIYGVPVSFKGVSHVCGRSKFIEGNNYKTLKMDRIQEFLFEISLKKFGATNAIKRLTLADLIINHRGLWNIYDYLYNE